MKGFGRWQAQIHGRRHAKRFKFYLPNGMKFNDCLFLLGRIVSRGQATKLLEMFHFTISSSNKPFLRTLSCGSKSLMRYI
jgi:hypothetical protein